MTPFPQEAVPLLLDWYRANRRDLPWREDRDPYRVLVSEIMLQQTRAETVKPYFRRFLSALPTVADLAGADEDALLTLWEGLGYYHRARYLREAARRVMTVYGGRIPADYRALLTLKGVGRYTAGAVASIAFDLPVPAVDGNVLRVLSRLTGDETNVLTPAARTAAERALAPRIPSPGAGAFTQSLIELGALVCVPSGRPACAACPLRLLCAAEREGKQDVLPVRLPRAARRAEERTVLVLRAPMAGEPGTALVALRKRPSDGLLGGLYEFPCLPGFAEEGDIRAFLAARGMTAGTVARLPDARHRFTHLEWRMRGFSVELAAPRGEGDADGWLWARETDIGVRYALPSAYAAYRPACREG